MAGATVNPVLADTSRSSRMPRPVSSDTLLRRNLAGALVPVAVPGAALMAARSAAKYR
jgi:hypothetical protein